MARIFYVMGASGAGKDSVMQGVREALAGRLVVAHRYITRPADAGSENHVELSDAEFDSRVAQGLFAMHWQANNHRYGIGCEIDHWLAQGVDVMLNGSRAYFAQARERYADQLVPVWVRIDQDVLVERLRGRGRESESEIQNRLARAAEYDFNHPADAWLIDNSGELAQSVAHFLGYYADYQKNEADWEASLSCS